MKTGALSALRFIFFFCYPEANLPLLATRECIIGLVIAHGCHHNAPDSTAIGSGESLILN